MNAKLATFALCVMISGAASAQAPDAPSVAPDEANVGNSAPSAPSQMAPKDPPPHRAGRVALAAGLGLIPTTAFVVAVVVMTIGPPRCNRRPGDNSWFCIPDAYVLVPLFALLSPPVTAALVAVGHAGMRGRGHWAWAMLGASLGAVTGGVAGYFIGRETGGTGMLHGPVIAGTVLSALGAVLFAEVGHARALALEKVPQLGFAPVRGGGVVTAGMQF